MNKNALIQDIDKSFAEVISWYDSHPQEKFDTIVREGKWTAGQHLEHLNITWDVLLKVMKMPKFFLSYKFGKCNREERDVDTIVGKYQSKLQGLPAVTTSRFEPKPIHHNEKQKSIDHFKKSNQRITKKLSRWSESHLSTYLIPHPLIGRMTVREMMSWAAYHNRHHLKTLARDY